MSATTRNDRTSGVPASGEAGGRKRKFNNDLRSPSPQLGRLLMAPPPSVPKTGCSGATASPGYDMLSEALNLNNQQMMGAMRRPPTAAATASSLPAASSTRPAGTLVSVLPDDWAIKRGCLVTSPSSLSWCARALPSVHAAALQSGCNDIDTNPSLALHHALLQWRHPATRLPPAIVKQFAAAAVGTAEREYAETANDAWDAALRSLYVSLRDGRLPYFYCRSEPSREASAASAGAFSVLWRNIAVTVDDSFEGATPPPPPLGWAATDDESCYAVLSPSSRVRRHTRLASSPKRISACGALGEGSQRSP